METRTCVVLAILSVVSLFALPFLQILAFMLVVVFIFHLGLIATQDGDMLLLLYEQLGETGSDLRGKVAWITGASGGIGEAVAYDLALKGVKLVLSARREEELNRVKSQCLQYGLDDRDVLVLPLDVSAFNSHESHAQTVLKHFQKVDILVNNAGRSQRALVGETKFEVDEAIINLNFLGQVSITKSVLPHMISNQAGHIVNISSLTGKVPMELSATYSASKHALLGYFGSLMFEYPFINITNVCPGPVKSNIVENAFNKDLNNQSRFKSTDGTGERSALMCMTAERCAALITVAIANKLSEVWIAKSLPLLLVYANHWAPVLTAWFKKKIYGTRRIREFQKVQEAESDRLKSE